MRPFEEITVECSEPWREEDTRYVLEYMEAVLEVSTLGVYIFSRVGVCHGARNRLGCFGSAVEALT